MRGVKKEMKKGSILANNIILWTFGFIIVALAISLMTSLIQYKGSVISWPQEVQSQLVSLKFTNNPSCFAFFDNFTQKSISNSVDLNKFNDENLVGCYDTGKLKGVRSINYKFVLVGHGVDTSTSNYANDPRLQYEKEVLVFREGEFVGRDILQMQVQII